MLRARRPRSGRTAHGAVLVAFLGLLIGGCSFETSPGAEGRDTVEPDATRALTWDEPSEDRDDPEVAPEILARVEAAQELGRVWAAGVGLRSTETLPSFYRERLFAPAWLDREGLSPAGRRVHEAIGGAGADGLRPEDYHLREIDSLFVRLGEGGEEEAARRAELDLLLTDGFLLYVSHLLHGRVEPTTIEPNWTASRNGVDVGAILREGISGEEGLAQALARTRPYGERYAAMQAAMLRYQGFVEAGGWAPIPEGETLDPGMRTPRVDALRRRLETSGEIPERSGPDRDLYDEELAEVVRSVQTRHGLQADARVGRLTIAALNVPAEARLEQLKVNLERWRWLPADLGDRHILVNIPGFFASVVDDGVETMRLRAIVGRAYRQTPVFSGTMTYLAFAPYWNVPPGIAQNDQLPKIREDPGYLASQNMTLFEAGTTRRVDPATVDWTGMTGATFNRRFWIRQEPGPSNALGKVKFMFPNRHNVYLHDTPARELFDQAARFLSSGCIRVERALELAAHLLRDDPSWTPERIERVVAGGREVPVTLPRPYQVHLQYFTAWVEADGTLQLRDDIYDRDARVSRALAAAPPS